MISNNEVISDALVGLVQAAIPTVNVHRDDLLPIESDQLPAVVVIPISDKPKDPDEIDSLQRQTRILTVRFEIRATGTPTSAIINPFAIAIGKAIMADPSIGGLALRSVYNQLQYIGEVADNQYAGGLLEYDFHYFSNPNV